MTALMSPGLAALPPPEDARSVCLAALARGSKSFDLAGKLLPRSSRVNAAVLYTYCRRADDAIDATPRADQERALAELEQRLSSIYRGEAQPDVANQAFAELVREVRLPRAYPEELLAGFAMDVRRQHYENLDDLLLYCHRVAGVVGLMMCHVMGVEHDGAQVHAAHLGIALQLTNICRDVVEDWELGRLYLPASELRRAGAAELHTALGGPLPANAREPLSRCVQSLLTLADRFYRSGDRGLMALPYRSALAVRTARLVYSDIGGQLRRRGCDPLLGRAVVPTSRKLGLAALATLQSLRELPARFTRRTRYLVPSRSLAFPADVLPLTP